MGDQKNVITSALDTIQLMDLLANDFEPRSLKQIANLGQKINKDWSQTKVFNMLETLIAANWIQRDKNDQFRITTHFASIAICYHQSIVNRASVLLQEIQETKIKAERVINVKK